MNDRDPDRTWPSLIVQEEVVRDAGGAVAVAAGLTHDVSEAVSRFVRERLPDVGCVLHCRPQGGISQQAVKCGQHCWQLAERTVEAVVSQRGRGRRASPGSPFRRRAECVRVLSWPATRSRAGLRIRVGFRRPAGRRVQLGDFRLGRTFVNDGTGASF